MLRILLEERLENFRRVLLIRAAPVRGRSGSQQRERIENLRFAIIGILKRDGGHGLLIGQRSGCVRNARRVFVKQCERVDKSPFAGRAAANAFCLLDFQLSARQIRRRNRRLPQLVIVRNRRAPVRHGALRIGACNFEKAFLRRRIPKRMQQRHGTIEGGLHGRRTRNGEENFAEFFGRGMLMLLLG